MTGGMDTTPKKSQPQPSSMNTTPKKAQPHPSKRIPPAPGIFNRSLSAGPIVPLQVLAFRVEPETMSSWVTLHQDLIPGETDYHKRDRFWRVIGRYLPPGCNQLCVVNIDNCLVTCIVVASNRNKEELEQARDVGKIEYARYVLDLDDPPRWYRPVKA
ncbi:hypothetical protein BDQ12DRAFT_738013 [Crucibulum laeve]|uniref:Uncharacterized protein n=1 Tax=Crucibulum laeve TaxID=68775 RepID=A0A5C3LP08_9AGAR|nr:hypothetical protein BDQ12DRAFT_738013 [Crucibulum laeve]